MASRDKKQKQRLESYEKAIEKQLHDDFQVKEYLNHNQLEGNIQEYLKLVNSLQVNNQQKRKKYDSLQVSFRQMATDRLDKTCQPSRVSNWESSRQSFETKYQQIQIKTSNQIEVKNTLWNEIIQTKKSINLMKGDIGHLINRNETANILSSKISKVKIVADDQLKRVTLAFSKDKDEIKQRKDMQQKFNQKLKNVSQFQNTSMNKLKETYMNVMVRKRKMHDRLAYIEKLSASIYQAEDKEKEKNRTNKATLRLYKNFEKLIKLIDKMPELQENSSYSQQTSIKDLMNEITNICGIRNDKTSRTHGLQSRRSKAYESQRQQSINSSDLQMVNEQNLKRFYQIVKQQFERLSEQIEFRKIDYNSKVKMKQYLAAKLSEVHHEITKIQLHWLNQAISQYVQTPSMKEQYLQKLNNFIYMIRTYQVLLEFIEKHLNYSAKVSYQERKVQRENKHEKVFSKTQTVNMRKSGHSLTRSLIYPATFSSSNILPFVKTSVMTKKSYISDLHKIYYALMREDESDFKLEDIKDNFFEQLGDDVGDWLSEIKQRIIQGNFVIKPALYKNVIERDETFNCPEQIKRRDANNKKVSTYVENEEEQVVEQYESYLEDFNKRQIQNEENNIVRYNSAGNFNERNPHVGSTAGYSHAKGLQHSLHSKIGNVSKLRSLSKSAFLDSEKKALRIKFLQDVDKDYFKMIKSTIQMEKQNTRKNYKFLKSFNRTKYQSNDQILEEKRFQSSFSTLFTSESKNATPIKQESSGQKSFFFINSKTQKMISKLQQSRRSITSSQVFRSLNLEKLPVDRKQSSSAKRLVSKHKDNSLFQSRHKLSQQAKEIINLF